MRGPRPAKLVWVAAIAVACGGEPIPRGAGDPIDAATAVDAGPFRARLALAVIEVVDATAIDHAILARWHAEDARVRALAEEQVVAFSALGDRVRALRRRRRDLVPDDSEWTRALQEDAWAHRERLIAARGRDFDRLWIEARIAEQDAAIELLDRAVLPATVDDQEVRELVIAARETLAATRP